MGSSKWDSLKAEKEKAMRRYNRLRVLVRLFRLVELSAALFLLSWLSTRLPFVMKVSGELLGKSIAVLASPLFMFLVGNIIVFTLLAKSGYVFAEAWGGGDMEEYVHDKIFSLKNYEPDDIMYEDKEIISEVSRVASSNQMANVDSDVNSLRRTQSENLGSDNNLSIKASTKFLQRSETEKSRKAEVLGEIPTVTELNNEEFQRAIDEFIAKQVKFHKEEKLAIVGSSTN